MINSKNLGKITFSLIILSLLGTVGFVYLANESGENKIVDYEAKLFGEAILEIDIRVNEEEWQNLLNNPLAKEYIAGDLIINGTKFSTVGIRTKGNSSLSQVAQMTNSDRYSLQFKSNYYVKGQTFYGLDSFCINNVISDSTYMKDILAYDLMNFIGVDTPLTNYASVTVNGEDFGFYIALERYDKSFLDRVYNTSAGELYNVKISMGFGGNFGQADNRPDRRNNLGERNPLDPGPMFTEDMPFSFWGEEGFGMEPPQMMPPEIDLNLERLGGMGSMGSRGGGSLVYIDDQISSYASIFENAEFRKNNSDKDKERVILAIKNLNEGKDLEKHLDVDKTLRYLAAHTVLVNLDSYSSNMAQNYYLYERNGKLTILPWDYNLAFGGFQSGSANDVINFPINTPVSGVSMEERPLINKLLEVDEYRVRYHRYLQEIVDGYFMSGVYATTILSIDEKISDYVLEDTTSFSGYDQYVASLPILIEFGQLRAESIKGQLDGSIPSTTEEQRINRDLLIDASHLNLSALGNMMGMGFGNGQRGNMREANESFINRDFRGNQPLMDEQVHQADRPFEAGRNLTNFAMGNQSGSLRGEQEDNGQIIFSFLLLGVALVFMSRVRKNY